MRTFGSILICLCSMTAFAQEIAVPNTPVVVTIASNAVTGFSMQIYPDLRFRIEVRDSTGKTFTDEHMGPEKVLDAKGQLVDNPNSPHALMRLLNTANFTTVTMMRRLYQHLEAHGKIPPSTVTGTPVGTGGDDLLESVAVRESTMTSPEPFTALKEKQ